jgi:hypothetical protein
MDNGDCSEVYFLKETKMSKEQKYCVLVWDKVDGFCGDYVYDTTGHERFTGTQQEAKKVP